MFQRHKRAPAPLPLFLCKSIIPGYLFCATMQEYHFMTLIFVCDARISFYGAYLSLERTQSRKANADPSACGPRDDSSQWMGPGQPAVLVMTALVGLVQGMVLVSRPVSRPRPPVYLETGISLFYRTSKASNGGSGQMLLRLVFVPQPGRAWRRTLRGWGRTGRASGLRPSGTSGRAGLDDARREQ